MTALIWEKAKSMAGEVPFWGQSSTREFGASGCVDSSALIALILANPSVVPAFDVVNGNSLFIEKYGYREFGGGCWDVTAHYQAQKNQWRLSGDTSGGTRKITQSIQTMGAYDCLGPNEFDASQMIAEGEVSDFQRALNVTTQGVEGVDVVDPKFDFTIQITMDMTTLSSAYLDLLKDFTGKTNDWAYTINYNEQSLSFASEELLFKGASFTQSSTSDLDLSFKFSAITSITAQDAEPQTVGLSDPIDAAGQWYTWFQYKEFNNISPPGLIKKAVTAYLERVYRMRDFTMLGLG